MKKQTMIDFIIEATENSAVNNRIHNQKKANRFERLHIRIDDQIKFCPKCNLTWTKNRKMYIRDYEYYPKNHIPIIGKEKLKCPNCKEK